MAAAGMPPSRRAERKGRSILRARNEHNAKFMTAEEQVSFSRHSRPLAHISRGAAAYRVCASKHIAHEGEHLSRRLHRLNFRCSVWARKSSIADTSSVAYRRQLPLKGEAKKFLQIKKFKVLKLISYLCRMSVLRMLAFPSEGKVPRRGG